MVWLERLICSVKGTESSPQGHSYYQVMDVVEVPRWHDNYVVDLNTCLVNNRLAIGTFGVAETTNESNTPSEPLYAWKVNIEEMKIVSIETNNVKCYFDFSYPKQ